MIVMKFGGSSLANSERIKQTVKIISEKEDSLSIVLSAMKGVTNLLIDAAQKAENGNTEYKK